MYIYQYIYIYIYIYIKLFGFLLWLKMKNRIKRNWILLFIYLLYCMYDIYKFLHFFCFSNLILELFVCLDHNLFVKNIYIYKIKWTIQYICIYILTWISIFFYLFISKSYNLLNKYIYFFFHERNSFMMYYIFIFIIK